MSGHAVALRVVHGGKLLVERKQVLVALLRHLDFARREKAGLLQDVQDGGLTACAAPDLASLLASAAALYVGRFVLAHLDLRFAAHAAVKTADAHGADARGRLMIVEVQDGPADRLDAQIEAQDVRAIVRLLFHGWPSRDLIRAPIDAARIGC